MVKGGAVLGAGQGQPGVRAVEALAGHVQMPSDMVDLVGAGMVVGSADAAGRIRGSLALPRQAAIRDLITQSWIRSRRTSWRTRHQQHDQPWPFKICDTYFRSGLLVVVRDYIGRGA
ncbi:hypothetical protein [Kutzneria sp. NPDC052558]|uniref:hypothetical protein n=1 Tax=Kutzneria sp. NPDC052558 TaxID=3364121 RepID=UPI0037CC3D91